MYKFPINILDVAAMLGLKFRRHLSDRAYTDCPLPNCNPKKHGKMRLNTGTNTFTCFYCGEYGSMLSLYAKTHNGISCSQAYREICDALMLGTFKPYVKPKEIVAQATLVDATVAHKTLSALFNLLPLSSLHRNNLRCRGLTDSQIDRMGYRSTPKGRHCPMLCEILIQQGHTLQGVPGFYQNDDGKWTINFRSWSSGIIVQVRNIGGLLCGAQIRLDNPYNGTKYLWLSSSGIRMGVSSGSPIHFVGNPSAQAVYLTEGFLKADIAHHLSGRTFAATAGGSNVRGLDELFAQLANSGTSLIVEALDMDKLSNIHIAKGTKKIAELAIKHGMKCRHLVWDANSNGIDDWLLHKTKNQNLHLLQSA